MPARKKDENFVEAYYNYSVFRTPYGWMGIVKTLLGLHAVVLPQKNFEKAMKVMKKRFGAQNLNRNEETFKELNKKMLKYFYSDRVDFNELLDLTGLSDFDRSVMQVVRTIPYGEVRSYRWVAETLGKPKAAQAVGQALSRNRLPIVIPCHRVVEKGGFLGGFSAGPEMKRNLLKIEGRIW